MYKKLTVALLLAMTATAGTLTNVYAQEKELPQLPTPSIKQFRLPISINCDTKEAMSNVIKTKYKEQPFITGSGTMTALTGGAGTLLPGVIKVWANPKTWSFSITIEDPNPKNDVMCLLTSGVDLKRMGVVVEESDL